MEDEWTSSLGPKNSLTFVALNSAYCHIHIFCLVILAPSWRQNNLMRRCLRYFITPFKSSRCWMWNLWVVSDWTECGDWTQKLWYAERDPSCRTGNSAVRMWDKTKMYLVKSNLGDVSVRLISLTATWEFLYPSLPCLLRLECTSW